MKEGPDLQVECWGKGCFYVECYTYRKSFDRIEFVKELFDRIDSRIKVQHASWAPTQLPSGDELETFFGDLYRPYLDEKLLESKRQEARQSYPVLLPVPCSVKNLTIYLEGENPKNYVPGRVSTIGGNPEDYLKVALRETVSAKAQSNSLATRRPNLLAINLALSSDFQVASALRSAEFSESLAALEFPGSIDAVVLGGCGINKLPNFGEMSFRAQAPGHPAEPLFPAP